MSQACPTPSSDNLPLSEKDCRKRKHSEHPNKENKRQNLEINIQKDTSVSPKHNELSLAINRPVFNSYLDFNGSIPVPIEGSNSYQQNTLRLYHEPNIVPFFTDGPLPCPSPYMVYSMYNVPGIQPQSFNKNEMGVCDQSYTNNIVKEVLKFSSCVLYPPDPNRHIPRRPKPYGCRTVYVGGIKTPLPITVTQDVIRDIFNTRENVIAVRMNNKGFCHVQFSCESEVEEALKLSGYQIRVEDKNEETHAVWIHVDYADSNKDQKELERAEREAERKARHETLKQINDTPIIPSFSKCEFRKLHKKLNAVFSKEEEKEKKIKDGMLKEVVRTLSTWLEKGEVNKKNAVDFYNIIQFFFQHFTKNQVGYKNEYCLVKSKHTDTISNITSVAKDIEKIMDLVKCQNSLPKKEVLNYHDQIKNIMSGFVVETSKEKIDVVCGESTSIISRSKEVESLGEKIKKAEKDIALLAEKIKKIKEERHAKQKEINQSSIKLNSLKEEFHTLIKTRDAKHHTCTKTDNKSQLVFFRDARLLSLVSQFLLVHPFKVNIEYITSYINKIIGPYSSTNIITLMKCYPSVFKDEVTGIGPNMERKWLIVKKRPELNLEKDGSCSS